MCTGGKKDFDHFLESIHALSLLSRFAEEGKGLLRTRYQKAQWDKKHLLFTFNVKQKYHLEACSVTFLGPFVIPRSWLSSPSYIGHLISAKLKGGSIKL